jgi:2-polyprenylphenol 6-hydroxylase
MAQFNSKAQAVDIAIVGGGIVGLSMALGLQRSCGPELSIALIDAEPESANLEDFREDNSENFNPRVSALTVASEAMFSTLEVWENIKGVRACPYTNMFVWDSDGTGSISFSAAEIQESRLGHIVENSLISAALNEALVSEDGIELLRPDSVSSIEPTQAKDGLSSHELRLKSGRCLDCKLVIGADGGNSFIRKQANFKTKEWDYQQQAIVTTVKTEKPHNYTATQCFMPSGPLAFLPLLDVGAEQQKYSSIVWSCVPDKATELMALDDEAFNLALQQAFEFKLGKVEQVAQRFAFPLWQKHAIDYVQDGIALIGDAAHTIHPLAGQGVNLGLLDVISLTEAITMALAKGEDYASHQTLSRYQRQRKGSNLGMMLVMEGFKHLFASDDLSLRWIRNLGISGVDSMPLIKNHLMKKAMGLRY